MSSRTLKPSSSLPSLLRAYWRDALLSWDCWLSVILALLVGILAAPKPSTLLGVASVEVGVASAFVGVVLAGLAIIAAFLDARYVAVLSKSGQGVMPELFQFRLTATAAVVSVIYNLGLILARETAWLSSSRSWALAVSVLLFTYSLFCMLNLIALIGGHFALRERQVERDMDDQT